LYGIALKLLATERRKQRSAMPAIDATTEPAAPNIQESGLWVREAIGKLDLADREIVMLREYEQLSYGEIADLLRVPVNTVRSRLFRARMALKDHLRPNSALQGKTSGATKAAAPAEGEA
jgi:RNA polymerase sigma factor (sigma-70 family)